jgi:predicted 3-demethylubiquinone-9 3-methyltransferase (glyoxalase superfamily)
MRVTQRISPFLWFDHAAEEAVAFYTGTCRSSSAIRTSKNRNES